MTHFKPEQLRQLIATVPLQHRLMILVGFWHGLRVSELIGLKSRNIQHGYIEVQRLKGSRRTLQPFVLHKDPMLSEYEGLKELAKRPLDMVLFPMTRFNVNKILTKANRVLDMPKCHPHMLKHTCARTMLAGGKTLPDVQARLGHECEASTLIYLKTTEEKAAEGMGELL